MKKICCLLISTLICISSFTQNLADTIDGRFHDDLFDHLELLQALPYIGAPIRGHPQLRRLLHSPLYVYYRVDENRGAIEILHFWHSSRKDPQF